MLEAQPIETFSSMTFTLNNGNKIPAFGCEYFTVFNVFVQFIVFKIHFNPIQRCI